MEWESALADLLLDEPEIRSWLGLDLSAPDISALPQGEPERPALIEQIAA